MTTSSSSSKQPPVASAAMLMETAFDERFLRGSHEWKHVDDVVRSSLLLLYRELRRQDKRWRRRHEVDAAADVVKQQQHEQERRQEQERQQRGSEKRWTLMQEQLQLLQDEVTLLKHQVRGLTKAETRDGEPRSVTAVPDKNLAAKVKRLREKLRVVSGAQQRGEATVVAAVAKNQQHVDQMLARCRRLERHMDQVVLSRLAAVEAAVRGSETTTMGVMRMAKQEEKTPKHKTEGEDALCVAPQDMRSLQEQSIISADGIQTRQVDIYSAEADNKLHDTTISINGHGEAGGHSSPPSPPLLMPGQTQCVERTDGAQSTTTTTTTFNNPLPPPLTTRYHASLRVRYQREHRRQYRRLERLRRTRSDLVCELPPQPRAQERSLR